MRITVLGCGGSGGVPLIGGDWGACDPTDPRNRRRRPSVLVEAKGTTLLIDTGPDLREQLLAADVKHVDAILYTHGHADHTHGIDDVRALNNLVGRPIDIFADAVTLGGLRERFGYCFDLRGPGTHGFHRPALVPHAVEGRFEVGAVTVQPFVQDHGWTSSLGFRIDGFAYSTDVVRLDAAAFAILEGIDTWVVDCVRIEPAHPVHAHLPVTLGWIERVRPRRAYLTHMNQMMDYRRLSTLLPAGVEPAYDGLVIEIGT